MRSFKANSKFDPSSTQPEIYSPSRNNYQARLMNVTETSKNKNRTQQIVLLHQEFEDLKKKIKQVENKNEKIIEKIHRQCNFKKKTTPTFDLTAQTPIIYYEKKQKSQLSQKSGLSVDDSNKSDQSEYEFKQKKPQPQRNSVQSNKHIPQKNFSQSMQYTRNDIKGEQLKKKYSKVSHKNYQEEEPDSRELIQDEFEESGDKFEMQGSHQTYNHLEYKKASGKSSGKKSAVVSSYPVSQTHMGYSMLNPQIQSNQMHDPFRHSQQQYRHSQQQFRPSQQSFHPSQQQYHHSQQQFNPSFSQQQPSRISSHSTAPNSTLVIYQLEESLKIEKEKTAYLEQELKNKEFQILTVKKEYNKLVGQFQSVEMILEDHLEQFFQNTVKKGFFQIDKTLKKYQNRLRNMAIHIKDQYEEHKSSRLIKEHQLRRSNSRSRKDLSPIHNTSIHSVIATNTSAKIPRPATSQGSTLMQPQPQNMQPSQTSLLQQQIDKRSRMSEQSRKNKEFEQIVQKYEEMINSKRDEISKLQMGKKEAERRNEVLEKELQTKDGEVREFKQRLQELDKLMSEMQSEGAIQSKVAKGVYRISSTESNLLQEIEQYNSDVQERRYQRMCKQLREEVQEKSERLSEVSQQMEVYEKKIAEYELRMREYESKVRRVEEGSSESIKVSQKWAMESLARKQVEESMKQHLQELHQMEIRHKDGQIAKYKQTVSRIEKKLVQKDCECISLGNKVKKLEGVSQLQMKKLEQYQKLLNHYQLNCSMQMGDNSILDRSICNQLEGISSRSTTGKEESGRKRQGSRGNMVSMGKGEFESLEGQLKEMSEEILVLTKKVKTSEKANAEKATEVEKAVEENDMLRVELQRLTQVNVQLRSRVSELEEEVEELRAKQEEENGSGEDNEQVWSHQEKSHSFQQKDRSVQQKDRSVEQKDVSGKKSPSLIKRHSNLQPLSQSEVKQPRKFSQQQSLQHHQAQESLQRVQEQLKSTKSRQLQLSAQYNHLKAEHLELSRNNITLKKNNEYMQESLSDREQKYEKCKRELEELKVKNAQLVQILHAKQDELIKEKQENSHKIQQLQKQWHEFQQQITKNNQPQPLLQQNLHDSRHSQLLKSSRYNISESSLLLSSNIHNKNAHYLQEQNQYLTIKLKQAEATIEVHNMMEQKVLNQYKANVDKLRQEVKEKAREVETVRKEMEVVTDAKRRLEVLYQSSKIYLAESRVSANNTHTIRKRHPSQSSVKQPQSSAKLSNKGQVSNQQQKWQQNQNQKDEDLSMQQFPSYNQDANNLSMLSQQPGDTVQTGLNPKNKQQNQTQTQKNQEQQKDQEERMYPYERIIQLEGELKQAKDINDKLQQMEEELFKQIRLKEQQKKDLLKLLDDKNLKILQLEEIVELKDNHMLGSSHLGSHILPSHISSSNLKSSSNYKSSSNPKNSAHNLSQRQSLHSHSSLRYSGITHLKNPTLLLNHPSSNHLQVLTASQMGTSQMGTSERFEIELSQTGSSMLDKSYVTNISEIFEKEQFPYQKVQLKRKEQIKLFQKTASYIKSLKESINEKNKKIKLLEKKIESLKNTHHGPISKQLQNKYEISTRAENNDIDLDFDTVFKDYESVQLQRKKASHNKRYKNLQHEWKLAIEQNNVLSNQVEVLQQQLQKAEEQQNTILVMKDLYKDQIKKLLAKNQQQTAYYEDLLGKEKAKLQESQSVHNLETIKQLFLKVMDSIIVMESDKSKKKRQEKRKQLEQFFKIFASLCAIQQPKKAAVLEGIKKMTLNIVLAEDGRAASKGKD